MKMFWFIIAFLGSSICLNVVHGQGGTFRQYPEQIRLAFGEKLNDIVVTWSTLDEVKSPLVKYGELKLTSMSEAISTPFKETGSNRKQYIHVGTMKDLKFNTTYFYRVGSPIFGWSPIFWFKTVPQGDDWTVRAVVFGDLGNDNAKTLSKLQDDTADGMYDFAIHVGDIAYNMNYDNGQRADAFLNQIEPIAAYMPYMTCPGNHEYEGNYTYYKGRFMMPGNRDGMYHSWDAGKVHFISISTEHYYETERFGTSMVKNQYEWLVKDLKNATSKENRDKRPWIIIYGHRPMYCSNWEDNEIKDKDCVTAKTRLGVEINKTVSYELESLLIKNGVDLVIWAHEHSYERTWPINNYTVHNGSFANPYVNPGAPVHIISGAAGSYEYQSNFTINKPDWSAFRSLDYSYSRMNIFNKSHLYFEQVSVDVGKTIDSFWLVKDKHGPYK